ncbi:hypothetical protein ACSQ67_023355 [Phaseolus vulgaris]
MREFQRKRSKGTAKDKGGCVVGGPFVPFSGALLGLLSLSLFNIMPKCLCSPFALLLAAVPRRLPADAALVAAPCLRDLWSLQIGFSLNADNCHPSSTIRGSTQCDELHPPRHIDPPSISMLT